MDQPPAAAPEPEPGAAAPTPLEAAESAPAAGAAPPEPEPGAAAPTPPEAAESAPAGAAPPGEVAPPPPPPPAPDIHWGAPLSEDPARAQSYRKQLESWLADPFTLDERWSSRALEEVNEEPTTVRINVEQLREMVKSVDGLHSRMDDHFLLAFLRSKRHDVEAAHLSLLKYYNMKSKNAEYFDLCLPSKYPNLYKLRVVNTLNGFDGMERPIVFLQADFSANAITNRQIIQMVVHLLEFFIIDPRAQISGFTFLADLAGQSVAHTRIITIKFLKLMLQIFQGSFPIRLRCIILCHGSFLFRATYAVIKAWIPDKFKERIHIMGSDVSKVLQFVPEQVVPEQLQGKARYQQELLGERVALVEDIFTEWSEYGFQKDIKIPSHDELADIEVTDEQLSSMLLAEAEVEKRKKKK